MKILLVESDKLLAENLSAALKTSGHKTLWHVDLQTALEVLDDDKPDAIILDLALANRSGAEFLYEVRSYPEWQRLPIFVWSDLTEAEARPLFASFKDLGVISYHHKSGTRLKKLLKNLEAQAAPA